MKRFAQALLAVGLFSLSSGEAGAQVVFIGPDYGYDPQPYGRTVVYRHDHYYHPVRHDHGHRGNGWGRHHGHHKQYKHHHYRGHDCD